VIGKLLKEDYPTPAELYRYQQEYEITRRLNLQETIKSCELRKYDNTQVMLLEDFGGESLKILWSGRPFALQDFLHLAIQITDALGKVHQKNVIHKDINPSNIVLHPQTGQLKIIDFGLSTILSQENPRLKSPHLLEGTFAYISPEQRGRMNWAIDKLKTFSEYVQQYPSGWKKRLELANLLYAMGRIEQAVEEYRQVIEWQQPLIGVRLQLGKLLQLMGREVEAVAVFDILPAVNDRDS